MREGGQGAGGGEKGRECGWAEGPLLERGRRAGDRPRGCYEGSPCSQGMSGGDSGGWRAGASGPEGPGRLVVPRGMPDKVWGAARKLGRGVGEPKRGTAWEEALEWGKGSGIWPGMLVVEIKGLEFGVLGFCPEPAFYALERWGGGQGESQEGCRKQVPGTSGSFQATEPPPARPWSLGSWAPAPPPSRLLPPPPPGPGEAPSLVSFVVCVVFKETTLHPLIRASRPWIRPSAMLEI